MARFTYDREVPLRPRLGLLPLTSVPVFPSHPCHHLLGETFVCREEVGLEAGARDETLGERRVDLTGLSP
jgi:hypothetical protein